MTALRVVQWATGNIGARSLRAVIGHPELELAGVYVTSQAKAGKDAGDLCGLPATGVLATNEVDDILALGADCVLYMPAACDFDEVCRILASGANVVTTRAAWIPRCASAYPRPAPRGRPPSTAPAAARGSSPRRSPSC